MLYILCVIKVMFLLLVDFSWVVVIASHSNHQCNLINVGNEQYIVDTEYGQDVAKMGLMLVVLLRLEWIGHMRI